LYLHELNEADRKRLPAWPVRAMRMGRLAIAATEQGKVKPILTRIFSIDPDKDLSLLLTGQFARTACVFG